jgi:hypothetical protein
MWLPEWLYKILPGIYAIAGLLTIYNMENSIGTASGCLLVCTAILVLVIRKDAR